MKTRYKTGFKFILFILFFINSFLESQQLALPKQDLTIVSEIIKVNEFGSRYSSGLFRSNTKNIIISYHSICNNMSVECMLNDNVTLSIITKFRLFDKQTHFPRVQKNRKVCFQLTKFFT